MRPRRLRPRALPDYARTRNLKDLPLAALLDYANPFLWDADLEKRVLRITCILESLGIQTCRGFAVLPRESLASRLGKEAVSLMARVWGGSLERLDRLAGISSAAEHFRAG